MMRIVVLLFIFVYANADDSYALPVPGCVVIDEECFTHSNGTLATPKDAEKICASNNGRLAIIQFEKTWKLLIEKFLKHTTTQIWLGFTLLPNSDQLSPNVDLKNMSAYWTPTKIKSSTLQQYIYSGPNSKWIWDISTNIYVEIEHICQYNVTKATKNCSIAEIDDQNIMVSSCLDGSTVTHNSVVEINCSPGYYLNSSKIITCRNGIWDKPRCVAGCQPPAPKHHAMLISANNNFDIGVTLFYVCEENYYNWRDFGKTHFTLTCQNDSTWSESDARCSLKQDFTSVTINATEITEEKITLKCGLLSTNITWIHNGKEVISSSAFTVSSQGYLLVNSNAEKIDGFYMCLKKIDKNWQIGNQTYNILGSKECKAHLESTNVQKRVFRESESTILNCPQDSDDRQIKWFKNGEEIKSNEYQKVIIGGGLVLKALTKRDQGLYSCQTTYIFKSNICKFNASIFLTVVASVESICGVKSKTRPRFNQPWFVILQYEDDVTPFCFGALLNDRWVVTSAFCLSSLRRKKEINGVFAQLGSRESRKKYPISLVKVHPNYRTRRNLNDIGLIRLGGDPVEFNDDIVPVCVSSDDIQNVHTCENSANLRGTLTGWSTNVTVKDDHFNLDSLEKNLSSKNECRTFGVCDFAEDKFCIKNDVTDDVIPEPAFGDYGSPFVVSHKGRENLLGIFTGGENDHYEYFTSIFHHYDWIKQTIT